MPLVPEYERCQMCGEKRGKDLTEEEWKAWWNTPFCEECFDWAIKKSKENLRKRAEQDSL